MNAPFKHHLTCPWCGKGEVLADGFGKLTISVQCPRCKNFYLGIWIPSEPQRRSPNGAWDETEITTTAD